MQNFSDVSLARTLARALAASGEPAYARRLLWSIGARHLCEALEREPAPRTVAELSAVLDGPARRPGEGAQLLRDAVRSIARRRPDLTVSDLAVKLARLEGLRRPA
jgi:hypothetical protein